MINNSATFRVRYGETDQMGIVNNAVYPTWFEVGRTELFRELNFSYAEIEKNGTMLPLAELQVKYHSPAYYEDILTCITTVKQMPTSKIIFEYEILNENGKIIATGVTIHAFIDAKTRRVIKIPDYIKIKLAPLFESN